MSDPIKVNTLIIGAGRSGTTSLCSYLEGHKEVCFSKIKEVHYFSINELFKRGEKYYHAFFRKNNRAPVIASADTYLLMDHEAISRIYAYNPGMKIIVMLRDPVARAYSSYNYSVNYGHHNAYPSFLDSLEFEKDIHEEADIVDRNNKGHFYGGLYFEHLSKWTAVFPRKNILLLKTSDLKEFPEKFSEELFSFLGLSNIYSEIGRNNAAAVPKNKKLEKFLLDRDLPMRKFIRDVTPRFLKNLIMESGVVDKLHESNRKEQILKPLERGEIERALTYFSDDLRLLKEKFDIEF